MKYPKEVLIKRVDEIPQNLQDVFYSTEKSDKLEQIAKDLGLSKETWIKMERATNVILLCMQPLSTFRSLLMGDVGLSYDQAVKVTLQITEKVFAPVMESLKKFEADPHVYDPIQSESENEIDDSEPEEGTEENGAFVEDESGEVSTTEEASPITPDHLIPNHETMEKVSGSHIHTQTTPQAAPASPVQSSIVDQKLRGLVRPNREETVIRDDVEKRRKIIYKDTDPYREPIE